VWRFESTPPISYIKSEAKPLNNPLTEQLVTNEATVLHAIMIDPVEGVRYSLDHFAIA